MPVFLIKIFKNFCNIFCFFQSYRRRGEKLKKFIFRPKFIFKNALLMAAAGAFFRLLRQNGRYIYHKPGQCVFRNVCVDIYLRFYLYKKQNTGKSGIECILLLLRHAVLLLHNRPLYSQPILSLGGGRLGCICTVYTCHGFYMPAPGEKRCVGKAD